MREQQSVCCGAPIDTEWKQGRINDRVQDLQCSSCGDILDVEDVEVESAE